MLVYRKDIVSTLLESFSDHGTGDVGIQDEAQASLCAQVFQFNSG